jgi:hypothetical protein
MKSSFAQLNSFHGIILHHLRLPTPLILCCNCQLRNSILCCNCQLRNSTQFSAATANSGTRLNSLLQLPTPALDSILCCNCQLRNSTQFSAATADSGTRLNSNTGCVRSSLYSLGSAPTENTASSIVSC